MAPKRKASMGEDGPSSKDRKKQKVAFARTIAVQQAQSQAGPSSAGARPSGAGLRGLPTTIDVEKFAEARAFEIDAMDKAMKNAKSGSTQRAWQVLPRHLRRRAASHDVRRVPSRLRDRLRFEMDAKGTKPTSKAGPKRGRGNRIERTASLLKRQRDKIWLETHIWHAKRMHMDELWGYKLAVTPTEKSFRPSHRAAMHGSILHDASYFSLVELRGRESILKLILELCCDPQGAGPGAKRYTTGARVLDTHVYDPGAYPYDFIGPTTILWRPIPGAAPTAASRKGKEKATTASADDNAIRTVWLRSHPSIHAPLFSALQSAASWVLDAGKRAGAEFNEVVDLVDLRENVNAFEIVGPKANAVLRGALRPIAGDREGKAELDKFWASLGDLQTSGSVPRGMVVGFTVHDPRLNFPPKNAKPQANQGDGASLRAAAAVFPSASLAQSDIWEDGLRARLSKPKFKKKDLDHRRSELAIPGTPLNPNRADDRVPFLLIQRSLEPAPPSAAGNTRAVHGWTLLVPAGWGMPFFSQLTYTGTRVGGLRERATQHFEAGVPAFPRDVPGTIAYDDFARRRNEEEKGRWERKPPAKRVNGEKMRTRSPWEADWAVVLGGPGADNPEPEPDLIPTQREEEADSTPARKVRPWLLRGADVPSLLDDPAGLLSAMNRLREKRALDPIQDVTNAELLRGALVSVRVYMCGRGAPKDMAMIYEVDDEGARTAREESGKVAAVPQMDVDIGPEEDEEEVGEEDRDGDGDGVDGDADAAEGIPPVDKIVGYVTSGNFSLSRGTGFAIGCIALSAFLRIRQQSARLREPSTLRVQVRNRDGYKCRAATLELAC